jgi:hypothetical protein
LTITAKPHNNHAARSQSRTDVNREMSLEAQRALSDRLREVLAQPCWWGKIHLTVSVEDSEIKLIEEGCCRTRRRQAM